MKTRMAVEARGKLFCSFPRTRGRVFFASTGPAASTGGCSRLHPLPRASVPGELLVLVMLRDSLVPWMIGMLLATPTRPGGDQRQWCHWHRQRWPVRRGRGGACGREILRSQLLVPHDAVAIANLDLAVDRFVHLHGGAGRRAVTLALNLEVPVVVTHDPVIRDGPLLLQS